MVNPKLDLPIQGYAKPEFEEVRKEFTKNFQTRGEIGAACAVYYKKQNVVDLWGGSRDQKGLAPWEENTLVTVASTTKGLAGIAIAAAHSRGLIDFDEKVATYWPEFAQNDKGNVTVRQLLSHQAGLCALDKPLTMTDTEDFDKRAQIVASQKPLWNPGTRHGYHAVTLGWYESELIRRVDPRHRSLGVFFQDEICRPLDLEFYIGLPKEIPDLRIADIRTFGLSEIILGLKKMPLSTAISFLNPWSITTKAFSFPRPEGSNEQQKRRKFLSFEGPGINGVGQVRSIAKAYGALATGGGEIGLRKETIENLIVASNPISGFLHDKVLTISSFQLWRRESLRNEWNRGVYWFCGP